MSNPFQPLAELTGSVMEAWASEQPAGGSAGTEIPWPVAMAGMSDACLLELTDRLGALQRQVAAAVCAVSAQVQARSPREYGVAGLAKRHGFGSAARLVAAATGDSVREAGRLIALGEATTPRQQFNGTLGDARYPVVAEALHTGGISVAAAGLITTMFDRVAPRADPEIMGKVEVVLAVQAADLPLDLFARVVRNAEAMLDTDGVAPREEEMHSARRVTMRQQLNGMFALHAILDPETAALVKASIEGIVTAMLRATHPECPTTADFTADAGADAETDADADAGAGTATGGALGPDARTLAQLQADALAVLARHVLGCGRVPEAPAVSMIVRVGLDELRAGVGTAEVDGIDTPLSAGTARRLAAEAELIPVVLGGPSLPLDVGRGNRFFTRAQRIALAERDGGCAACGLDAVYCHAHHIRWWKKHRGRTDLSNGVLLCPNCHRRIHDDGWNVNVEDGRVWFTPPPDIDPTRTPRLGGRARYRMHPVT